jgi:hypothetical protein
MSYIINRAELYNRQTASVNKAESRNKNNTVSSLSQKSDVQTRPNSTSSNSGRLLEQFYAQTHNLKANYSRLKDKESQQNYYKQHRLEALEGGKEIIKAINTLLDEASSYDHTYGTYYHFLTVGLLYAHRVRLNRIGIFLNKDERVYLKRSDFYNALTHTPECFDFLFNEPHSLISELDKIYIRLVEPEDTTMIEGQILDIKG